MPVRVMIPTPLRAYAGRQESLELEASSVGALLESLTTQYPDLRKHLYSPEGRLRSFVNIYVNDEDIRYRQGEATALAAGDVVSIVPSIAGGAPEPAAYLTRQEILRYSRHLIMPEVALEGQLRLKGAKVALVGTGGLGAPLGLYLTAAGVGTIGLVDFDVVDFTNLQRQVTFGQSDVGKPKIEAAAARLRDLNPDIHIITHETRLESDNAMEILSQYDIVVDGTDNFPTRYLVNDACVLLGKPNVYGSIFRFEGQASVFALPDGPCYRCLYPEPPPPGLVPSCAEGGVLGILPGIVGAIQANEAVKLILGVGDTLKGRLLLFDALGMKFRELRLRKNPECPVCGPDRTIHELIDYAEFCGIRGEEMEHAEMNGVPSIEPVELRRRMDAGEDIFLLDVREPHEQRIASLGGVLMPPGEIARRVHELDSARTIVAYCRSGPRSAAAVDFLRKAGFQRVLNLRGGLHAWSREVDPQVPVY